MFFANPATHIGQINILAYLIHIQCIFLTVAIGNCMVKLIPPVNFCSDENIQTIFGTKLEDFFKLSDRLQCNILDLDCRKSCEKNIF
jgi:hypothetical protein